jgi:predicted DNA-binding transcriptional regulator YafY
VPSQNLATQLKRIFELIRLLPSRQGALTAEELFDLGRDRHQWKTTTRTIHRDLKALSALEIATSIEASAGRGETRSQARRWYLVPGKDLRKARLSTDQALALLLIERVASQLLPAQIGAALKPQFIEAQRHLDLYRNVTPQLRWADKVEVVRDGFARAPKDINTQVLNTLQQALLTDRQVSCRYRSRQKGKSKLYALEPRALVQDGPVLYVIATRPDRPNYDPGWFAVHRFISVRPLEDPVTARAFSLKAFLAAGGAEHGANGKRIAFKARVSRAAGRRLREAPLSADQRFKRDAGGMTVNATVSPSFPFENWLLGVADEVVVLEPVGLREKIMTRLHTALQGYGDG